MILDDWQSKYERYLQDHFTDEDGAHDIAHFRRVWGTAQRIMDDQAEPLIILTACYFHDIVSLPKIILNGTCLPVLQQSARRHCLPASSLNSRLRSTRAWRTPLKPIVLAPALRRKAMKPKSFRTQTVLKRLEQLAWRGCFMYPVNLRIRYLMLTILSRRIANWTTGGGRWIISRANSLNCRKPCRRKRAGRWPVITPTSW
ncbi:hypothetical protein ATHEMM101B_15270 [Atlantibacter hermannii]